MLLYTYISRFSVNPHYQQQLYLRPSFIAFFSLSHKWPMFAFTSESGYTLGFRRKIAHKGTHGETGGVLGGGWYHYPRSVPHVSETLRGQGVERQTLPLLGLGWMYFRRTQRAFGTAMRLCASLSRRRRSPAGLRDLFRFCRNCGLYALRSGPFRVCEARGGITLEMSRNVQSGNTQNLKSSAASDQAAVCACARSRYFAGGSPSGLRV